MTRSSKLDSQAAKRLSRLGASKGGKARAAKLNPEQRREIAKRAAAKRWEGQRGPEEAAERGQ